jgi:glutaredoxin
MASVTLYTTPDCSLCERALDVVRAAQGDIEFELEVVEIDGDRALEAAYREHLPVVEIDGERVFTYFVQPEALRARLAAATGGRLSG